MRFFTRSTEKGIHTWSLVLGVSCLPSLFSCASASQPTISTTSGELQGVDQDGGTCVLPCIFEASLGLMHSISNVFQRSRQFLSLQLTSVSNSHIVCLLTAFRSSTCWPFTMVSSCTLCFF